METSVAAREETRGRELLSGTLRRAHIAHPSWESTKLQVVLVPQLYSETPSASVRRMQSADTRQRSRSPALTRRTRRLKLALVGAGVAMGVALAAGGFYFSRAPRYDSHAYEGIYRESADPVLRVELIPRGNRYINADGFFGRDYARAKPANTWRIVGVGDSVTMYYSAEQLGYLSLLERALPAVVGRNVEVLNLAVVSYETPQQVRSLVTRGLRYEPDLVIVGYCVNDGTDFVQLANAR